MAMIRVKRQSGFSLMEVIIAMAILVVGLLAVLGLLSYAAGMLHYAQQDQVAREKAQEALESVISARSDAQLTFDSIQNASNGGVFLDGPQPLRCCPAGPDGLINTADDVGTPIETYTMPDGSVMSLGAFQRQVTIVPVPRTDGTPNPDLRQVTVTVTYPTTTGQRDYTVATYISRYR